MEERRVKIIAWAVKSRKIVAGYGQNEFKRKRVGDCESKTKVENYKNE